MEQEHPPPGNGIGSAVPSDGGGRCGSFRLAIAASPIAAAAARNAAPPRLGKPNSRPAAAEPTDSPRLTSADWMPSSMPWLRALMCDTR